MEKGEEESNEEEDKLFNFFGDFVNSTGGAIPMPESYIDEPHSCLGRQGCCRGFKSVGPRRSRRNRRYKKVETPDEWYEEGEGMVWEVDEWNRDDMEWDQEREE